MAFELGASYRQVVINASHGNEDLAGLGGPPRFAVTRTMLTVADAIVGVLAPTPVGVARFLEWAADARTMSPATPLHAVVDRAPSSRFKRSELAEELRRSIRLDTLRFFPVDPRVDDAAWSGALVSAGPFTRAVGQLAAELVDRVDVSRPREQV